MSQEQNTQALPGIDLDKLEALALAYTYENGDHWYCLPQIAYGITYEPAANFITGFSPDAALSLIAQARAAQAAPNFDRLHSDIMNLPCDASPYDHARSERIAYKYGHRDARHAAAELVNAFAAQCKGAAQAAVPVVAASGLTDDEMTRLRRMMRALKIDEKRWDDEEARDAMCTIFGMAAGELERAAASHAAPAQPAGAVVDADELHVLRMKAEAWDEWQRKTEWVQEQSSSFPSNALGKHRADVMREEIERLRATAADTTASASDVMKLWDSLPDAKMPEARASLAPVAAQQAAAKAPAAQAVDAPNLLNAEELAALRRFDECAQDGEGYDVPKEMMQRLAEIGVVRRKSGAYYEHTDFGQHVLGNTPKAAYGDDACYRTARELALAIWRSDWADIAPQFEPLDDLMGVLSQIDNMVSGMSRRAATPASTPEASQQAATCSHVWNDFGQLGGRNVSWCPRCDTLAWTGKEPVVAQQAAAVAAPSGYVLVPELPTLEMQKAAMNAARNCVLEDGQPRPLPSGYELWSATYVYRAMIEAAPSTAAAAVAAPSEQQANVLPPFAAPAGQQEAITEVLTDDEILDAVVHVDPSNYGLPVYAGECVDYIGYDLACARIVEAELTRRFRAQGGNTNAESSSAAAATTSEDARDAARYRYLRETTKAIRNDEGTERIECTPERFDRHIDAAMRATQQEGE